MSHALADSPVVRKLGPIPSFFDSSIRRVSVWGYGREGAATVDVLRRLRPDVTVTVVEENDSSAALTDWSADSGVTVVSQASDIWSALSGADFVVRSPGISAYDSRAAELRALGIRNVNSTAWWMATTDVTRVVGISGSKGKSTSSTLLAHLLEALGADVRLGGNIGKPVIGWLTGDASRESSALPLSVVEISSFQITDLTHSPRFGVLTALFPDHIDWHTSLERYEDDKLNLCAHNPEMSLAINANSDALVAAFGRSGGASLQDVTWYGDQQLWHARGTAIWRGKDCIIPEQSNPLIGHHNANNSCGVFATLESLGYDIVANAGLLAASMTTFKSLPHRLETIAVIDGVRYVNDGLSTNADGTVAALRSFPGQRVFVILGGHDRGIDYSGLGHAVATRPEPTVVLAIPDNGPRIVDSIRTAFSSSQLVRGGVDIDAATDQLQIEACQSLVDAVEYAAQHARAGDVVLLSPAAPSFGHFVDYRHRGQVFCDTVLALKS
jgi:UDP-N-acetylmuramoylalanine--D-glutamate ligase